MDSKTRKIFLSISGIALIILVCVTAFVSIKAHIDPDFFDNSQVNELIDANYEQVLENGWAELRIPASLHGIDESSFSANALDAAQKLIDAGYDAYFIGGAIRDLVMGTETMDFDITTNAPNDAIKEIFDNVSFHSIPTGASFAFVHYPDEVIDVATCVNIPAEYYGLKGVPDFDPDEIYSDNFIFDSFQRDFTINAIYYDVKTKELVDYHGGLHDIREGILETMVDASVAVSADTRKAVRGMRFKARYGFEFSDSLEKVMREKAPVYVAAAADSNSFNVPKFFNAGYAQKSYEVLSDYGTFTVLFSPISDIYETEGYQQYIKNAMKWMDEYYETNGEFDPELALAVILYPAYETTKDAEALLDEQNTAYTLSSDEKEYYINLFSLETEMEEAAGTDKATELLTREGFDNAYDLLAIRAVTNDSLSEIVDFYSKLIN